MSRSSRDDYIREWTPRIGSAAAAANRRWRRLRLAAPTVGLACIVLTAVCVPLNGAAAVVVFAVLWLAYMAATVQTTRAARRARRLAGEHLQIQLRRRETVPIRSLDVFDDWVAARSHERDR